MSELGLWIKMIAWSPGRLLLLVAAVVLFGPLSAARSQGQADHKRRELVPMQAEMTRLQTAYRDDEDMRRFGARLTLIDEVTALLVKRGDAAREDLYGVLLDEILDTSAPVGSPKPKPVALGTEDIYAEYRSSFAKPLPVPKVSSKEKEFLASYYAALLRASGEYVSTRCKVAGVLDEDVRRVSIELQAVIPFLQIPDRQWSDSHVEWLPEALRLPVARKYLEAFALRVRRPNSALRFAMYKAAKPWDAKAVREYLVSKSGELVKQEDFGAGVSCLRVGVELCAAGGDSNGATALRILLADLYDRMEQPALAAGVLADAVGESQASDQWGKAVVLRLKYLYQAGDCATIISETSKYRTDKRCAAHLPQIVYIAWVANRRRNKQAAADELLRFFIKEFPKHLLCADMYFSSAMTALAASNYDEALRLLEIIVYRYPNSRIVTKAKEITERVKRTEQRRVGK